MERNMGNAQPVNGLTAVNVQYLGSKMSSKREVSDYQFLTHILYTQIYRFLQTECRCFLDKIEVMTIFHLRDLANKRRRKIYCENVKVYQAPQYKGLN